MSEESGKFSAYDFSMTPQMRREKAAELRAGQVIEPIITEEMRRDLAAVEIEEISVPTRLGDTRVLKISGADAAKGKSPLYINFHGGGFVRGYHLRDTVFCAQAVLATGALVLDVDYRLAPEHPFPAALNECYDIVAWAFENADALSVDRDRIAIGGHSAGGNFATAICIMARAEGKFRPCGQILDYPFLDGITPPIEKADPRSAVTAERMEAYNVLYAEVPENLHNPLLSPVEATREALEGLPPALMLIAGRDPLRHEAQRYAGLLARAGVDIDVRQFAECDHSWVISGQGRYWEARTVIFDWLNKCFG